MKLVEHALGKTLDDYSKGEVPIFLNEEKLSELSITDSILLEFNKLHAKPTIANVALKSIVNNGNVISNRTGAILNITPRRLRYTIATMLSKDGYNDNIIAELLDHSSTSSIGIYIKNIADSVERIDSAVSEQLSFVADIFMNGIKSKRLVISNFVLQVDARIRIQDFLVINVCFLFRLIVVRRIIYE